jgi:uncharacterized RDD family membrane protein YckC
VEAQGATEAQTATGPSRRALVRIIVAMAAALVCLLVVLLLVLFVAGALSARCGLSPGVACE